MSAKVKLLGAPKAVVGGWELREIGDLWEMGWEERLRWQIGKNSNIKLHLSSAIPVIPVFFCPKSKKKKLEKFADSVTKLSVRKNGHQ